MKKLVILAVLLTSVTSFSRPRMVRDCDGDQRSPVNLSQVQTAAGNLLQSAATVSDRQQALARLVNLAGTSDIGAMTTNQYYAQVALFGKISTIYDLVDGSCPVEYPGVLNLLQGSQQIVESLKK